MKRTGWIAVTVGLVVLCSVAAGQEVATAVSHLGNEGPVWTPGATPSKLGWGPDEQAHPDRFVVDPGDLGEYVWVPAGEFMMGTTGEEAEYVVEHLGGKAGLLADEQPAHTVRITKGFWLGKHEVTNAQYRAFCEATGREFPEESDQGDDHPVVSVSWDDAVAYAEHYGLRLPTEAEWEYAARGPEGQRYPWGDEWNPQKLCWELNTGPGGLTFPVGSFPAGASWVGALDMAGNVWEWVADWYGRDYYASSPVADPRGPSEAEATHIRLVLSPLNIYIVVSQDFGGCLDP